MRDPHSGEPLAESRFVKRTKEASGLEHGFGLTKPNHDFQTASFSVVLYPLFHQWPASLATASIAQMGAFVNHPATPWATSFKETRGWFSG